MREERTKNGVNYKVNYIYAGGEAIGFTLRGQRQIDLDGAKDQDFPFYYVKDAQGNVRKIVDRMGNCVVKYNYNAWGKETVTPVESTWEFPLELNSDGTVKKFCIASDIAELNRLTYRGYFYNREIGLYYLINRYYDPETGRFISADDAEYLDFQTLYGSNRYMGNDSNATFLGNKPLFSKYKQFINKPVVLDDAPVYEFSLYDHFSNVKNAIETIGGLAMLFLVQWAKQSHLIEQLAKLDRDVSGVPNIVSLIGLSVAAISSVAGNIQRGSNTVRIVTDAIVDTSVALCSIAASIQMATIITASVGSVVPGVGTLIGVAVGLVVGLVVYFCRDIIQDIKVTLYNQIARAFHVEEAYDWSGKN